MHFQYYKFLIKWNFEIYKLLMLVIFYCYQKTFTEEKIWYRIKYTV